MSKQDKAFFLEVAAAWAEQCHENAEKSAGALVGAVGRSLLLTRPCVLDVQHKVAKYFGKAWAEIKGEQAVTVLALFVAVIHAKL